MTNKSRQVLLAKNLDDGLRELPTPAAGIGVEHDVNLPRVSRIRLADLEIAVAAADDFGSALLLTLPDRNLAIDNVECDLTLVKAGTTNGLVAATDLNVAIGTVATAAIDHSNANEQDVLELVLLDTNALSLELETATIAQTTASMPVLLADAADNELYLNVGAVGGITADDTLAVTGFIDIYWRDLGNRAS